MTAAPVMGPMLPEGVLEGDGADRGIIFIAAGAHLERQYEFVRTEWVDQGLFFGTPDEKDPLVRPTQPVFMINGKHDHLAPIGNIYFMLESGPPSRSERPGYTATPGTVPSGISPIGLRPASVGWSRN